MGWPMTLGAMSDGNDHLPDGSDQALAYSQVGAPGIGAVEWAALESLALLHPMDLRHATLRAPGAGVLWTRSAEPEWSFKRLSLVGRVLTCSLRSTTFLGWRLEGNRD
ncbi:MAG: hypothetical protein R3C14_40485 [Caldilineaceae bacterium]